MVDINRFIFIYYRDKELLVNQEIGAQFPDIAYKSWLDRMLPEQDRTTPKFPLRARLGFFLAWIDDWYVPSKRKA